MDLIDLAILHLKKRSPMIYQFEWYGEITEGLAYDRMRRLSNSIGSLDHLMLFFKLVQMDIYRSQSEEDRKVQMEILGVYIAGALRNFNETPDIWLRVRELNLLEFAREWGMKIPGREAQDACFISLEDYTLERPVPEQMPALLTAEESMKLYIFLREHHFISMNTSPASFHYRMGVLGAPTDDQRPICWQKTKQHLREMLELCFESLLKNKAITKSELEKRVSKCFIDRQGLSMKLSKNRPAESTDSDLLLRFFGKTIR